MSTEAFLREEICRVGLSLFERGYVHATAGNISVKLDDGFLITPTDACLGHLQPERLARIEAARTQSGGDRASRTLALHRRIYGADAAARCVIHTHSTHPGSADLAGRVGRARRPAADRALLRDEGRPVTLIPCHRPGDAQVGELVAQRIAAMATRGRPIHAVMLDRLGPDRAGASSRLDCGTHHGCRPRSWSGFAS